MIFIAIYVLLTPGYGGFGLNFDEKGRFSDPARVWSEGVLRRLVQRLVRRLSQRWRPVTRLRWWRWHC
jgi:hypothetical protein